MLGLIGVYSLKDIFVRISYVPLQPKAVAVEYWAQIIFAYTAVRRHCTDWYRVAEVAREHGWPPPKNLDSDENFKPEHTLFCRELRFVAIYALFLEIFGHKKCLFG